MEFKTSEKQRIWSLNYYRKNREKYKQRKNSAEYKAERRKEYGDNKEKNFILSQNPIHILRAYRSSSQRRQLVFKLSVEDVDRITKLPCTYCGVKSESRVGIDRVDNSIGYDPSNCVSCCIVCNRMKRTMSVKDFIGKCKEIVKINIQL